MTRKKNPTCIKWRCDEPPYLSGLCQQHHEENQAKRAEERAAIDEPKARLVNGRPLEKPGLNDELRQAARWWNRACLALQQNREDEVLKEETEYALSWCTSIAGAIIKEEEAYRNGRPEDPTVVYLKGIAWERFENLEAGLMSNGVERPRR